MDPTPSTPPPNERHTLDRLIAEDEGWSDVRWTDLGAHIGKPPQDFKGRLISGLDEAWIPDYCNDLNVLREARARVRDDLNLRVRYLSALRRIVGEHCEKNKIGVPIVSDFDLLDAEPYEHARAYALARKLIKPES